MAKYGTEQQALRRAKAWARQEYAVTPHPTPKTLTPKP